VVHAAGPTTRWHQSWRPPTPPRGALRPSKAAASAHRPPPPATRVALPRPAPGSPAAPALREYPVIVSPPRRAEPTTDPDGPPDCCYRSSQRFLRFRLHLHHDRRHAWPPLPRQALTAQIRRGRTRHGRRWATGHRSGDRPAPDACSAQRKKDPMGQPEHLIRPRQKTHLIKEVIWHYPRRDPRRLKGPEHPPRVVSGTRIVGRSREERQLFFFQQPAPAASGQPRPSSLTLDG